MRMAAMVCLAAGLAAGASAASAAELKIGVVDMAKVMDAYPETQRAEATLQTLRDDLEKERKDLLEKRQTLRTDYEAASKEAANRAWSDAERQRKEAVAEEKLELLRGHEQNIRETLELRQRQVSDQMMRMRQRILARLQERIGEYARANGFDLVLDGAEGGGATLPAVIYRADRFDITEAILKTTAMDAAEAPAEGAAKAPQQEREDAP